MITQENLGGISISTARTLEYSFLYTMCVTQENLGGISISTARTLEYIFFQFFSKKKDKRQKKMSATST